MTTLIGKHFIKEFHKETYLIWANAIESIGLTLVENGRPALTQEEQNALYEHVKQTAKTMSVEAIRRSARALFGLVAANDAEKKAIAEEKLSSSEYLKAKGLRVVRPAAPISIYGMER